MSYQEMTISMILCLFTLLTPTPANPAPIKADTMVCVPDNGTPAVEANMMKPKQHIYMR